ncbi:thiamine pyrophosphate-binding protein [Leucobacter sp. USHLN153]|uniref:thiamine pyrophosphate-binding protein n=1 Tax=Leucobacter sp. USHLN153 TaxID=3081268 RepID=UPI00301738AA
MLPFDNAAAAVTLSDAIARRLKQYGVQRVFGIPGTHNLELFRALGVAGVEVISAHHEQGLGYAADAYSRVSGKPAVVVTTTGPGITNLITALATSLAASVPVLAIAPGIPESGEGGSTGWLHDLPSQQHLMGQLVRSARVQSAQDAVLFIDEIAQSWQTDRPLPAYLEVPFDRFTLEGRVAPRELPKVQVSSGPAQAEIERAAQRLVAAARPLVVVGRGGTHPDAANSVRQIAEALGAPVMTTANAKGVLDEAHPLSLGVSLRVNAAKEMLEHSDAVLVVGSDLGSSEFWGPCPSFGDRLIRIDVDALMIRANAVAEVPLLGRSEAILPKLAVTVTEQLDGNLAASTGWETADLQAVSTELASAGEMYRRFHELVQEFTDPLEIAIAGDSSQVTYLGTATYWKAHRPNRFLYPAGYGTLGYAIPAAIGAALTGKVERVLAITGEGGMLFSVQELATAAAYDLPIVTIVFANGGYQEIREGMEAAGIAPVGVDFDTPDFVSIARGFGIEARSVVADGADENEFREALSWALEQSGPTLIEVQVTDL